MDDGHVVFSDRRTTLWPLRQLDEASSKTAPPWVGMVTLGPPRGDGLRFRTFRESRNFRRNFGTGCSTLFFADNLPTADTFNWGALGLACA